MEITLVKKITTKFFVLYFGIFLFINLFYSQHSFQSRYLFFHNQKVATDYKEQNKKRIMTTGLQTKKVIQC